MIQSEVAILRRVKHKNIIRLFDMFESPQKIFLVMELVTGGELFDRIIEKGHYSEPEAAKLLVEILMGVDYLHSRGICHRDLKPENLLFYDKSSNARIMISDFGLSKIFDDVEVMRTACGTPGYVAPEVLRRQGYTRHVDMWSVGVITYILLSGYPPFYEENNHALFQQIIKGNYTFDSPYWDKVSNEAKSFISQILIVDPKKRLTTSEALAHPFLNKYFLEVKNQTNIHSSYQDVADVCIPPQNTPPRLITIGNPSPIESIAPYESPSTPLSSISSAPTQSSTSSRPSTYSASIFSSLFKYAIKNLSQRRLTEKDKALETQKTVQALKKQTNVEVPMETIMNTVQTKPNVAKSAQLLPVMQSSSYQTDVVACGAPLRPKDQKTNGVDDSGTVVSNSIQYLAHPSLAHHVMHHHHLPHLPTPHMGVHELHHPSSVSSNPMKTIRLLSYSIYMRAPGLKNSFSDYKNARLEYFVNNVLPAYGIVCLQEMYAYGSNRLSRFLQMARELKYEYVVLSPSKGLLNGCMDAGLLILTRYPILQHAHLTFRRSLNSCRFIAKGAMYARIALGNAPGQHLHLFNTHLQKTNPSVPRDQLFHEWQVRQDQILELRSFIIEQTANKHPLDPILLVGDFNLNSIPNFPGAMHSEEYKALFHLLCQGSSSQPIMLWLDTLLQKYGHHPITYGDIDKITKAPLETMFTDKLDQGSCRATDYALWCPGSPCANESSAISLDLNNVRVEPLKVTNQPYTQLSDHYAIQVSLNVPIIR
ncbi:hypothetical protein HMI55_005285 [Coelomomyces lativittatus]|nr:hypothetical protein HMI55_005285 [Coelomomyces lativittatus]